MIKEMDIVEKENIEIDYWKNSKWERPDQFGVRTFLSKTFQSRNFNYKANRYKKHINGKKRVLELGAGQGWASCFLKRFHLPEAHCTVSDISSYAIESIHHWEQVLDVQIDQTFACKSYEIPSPDNTYDLIFCYAAAHHFVLLDETLKEIQRVLQPNGKALFLYEPTCSKLFYPLHFKYVNRNPHVPEDILIVNDIQDLAKKHGLSCHHFYDPKQVNINSIVLGAYFSILSKLTFLQRWLPSSSDFVFVKK